MLSPHPVDIHVGKRLRTIRILRGMVQENLGEMVGLTTQQIQKYEKGQNRISASRLYEFSVILDVPIAYFFAKIKNELQIKRQIMKQPQDEGSLDSNNYVPEDCTGLTFLHDSSDQLEEERNYDHLDSNLQTTSGLIELFLSIKEQKVRDKVLQLIKALAKNNNISNNFE